MSFTAVGLMIGAMIGAGVAEESGLVGALIRKLVLVSPAWALTYILAFVGIISSVAADAGYLVLIPLAGIAYLSVGRHPLAGLALGFAAVAGAFTVNMLIKPLDAVPVEFTNDAARLVDPNRTIGLASNVWFSIVSVLFLTVVVAFITDRVIAPRLGAYRADQPTDRAADEQGGALSAAESRGLSFALMGLIGLIVVFGFLTLPAGAPLRNPDTGELIGNSPFMNGLIALIMLAFLVTGWAYGIGAGTVRTLTDVIKAIEKAVTGLGGTIFLFFVLSQFVAYFTYTNIGTVMALGLNYIPFIGPFIATMFPTLFALVQFASWQTALAVFACLNVIQFVIGSYIEPRLSGIALAISPFVVLLAVFFWTYLWGVFGAFIGVPITIAMLTFCAQHPSSRWVSDLLGAPGQRQELSRSR